MAMERVVVTEFSPSDYLDDAFVKLRTVAERLKADEIKTAVLDEQDSRLFRTTNDIDLVVSSLKVAVRIFSELGFFIQIRPIRRKSVKGLPLPQFRACYSVGKKLLTVDLIHVKEDQESVWNEIYLSNESHPLVGFPLGNHTIRVAWKTYKYFSIGNVAKVRQLVRLRESWQCLDKDKMQAANKVLLRLPDGQNALGLLKKLVNSSENNNLPELLKISRGTEGFHLKEKNRIILSGSFLVDRSKIFSQVFRALFFKTFLRYKISAFPVVAFVGNDGGGKTSTIGELSSHALHKIDPIVVSMKRKDPFFGFTKVIKSVLIPLKKNQREISDFGFLSGPANWILEVVDYFDRLVRFGLGLLWARCGLGPVFFDRYVTDRLRGEYCRDNFRLHPLEQFFPMPDSFIFFDVPAEVSVERKPEDNHNLIVLREKRENYLRLMKEISRVHYIDGTRMPVDVHESANVFILSMCREINASKIEGKGEKWERASWTPN